MTQVRSGRSENRHGLPGKRGVAFRRVALTPCPPCENIGRLTRMGAWHNFRPEDFP